MSKEWKKTHTIYWSDELHDDFDEIGLSRPEVPKNYHYIRNNPFNNFVSDVFYYGIARPIFWIFLKCHSVKVVNKRNLKKAERHGAFIYSNHVSFIDVLKFHVVAKKRVNILGYSDSLSMPVVRNLCRALGYLPLPLAHDVDNFKRLGESFCYYTRKKQLILIYPEAHIWPYYTKIRNFIPSSFIYPAKCLAPVLPAVTIWRKPKFGKKPKQTIVFGNLIHPSPEYSDVENRDYLHKECLAEMKRISEQYEQYEYIKYIKSEKGEQ